MSQLNPGLKDKKVFGILGPTSSGKTTLALKIAKEMDAEIVSVDSRQLIKRMDVGTGKVPVSGGFKAIRSDGVWEINGVKVWGYDVFNPDQFFTVQDYLDFIGQIKFTKKNVLFVGGTGFYFDVILGNVKLSGVEPNKSLRDSLQNKTSNELFETLEGLDARKASSIDRHNKVRLIRAIEIAKTGDIGIEPRTVTMAKLIGLMPDRSLLYGRSDLWVDSVFELRLIDEVQKLVTLGFRYTPPMKGLIYKTALRLIDKEISEEECVQRSKFDIHAYIRRQISYFNRIENVEWFDPSKKESVDDILNLLKL